MSVSHLPRSLTWLRQLSRISDSTESPTSRSCPDDLFLWWPTTAQLKEPCVPEFIHVPIQVTSEHPLSVVWQHLLTRHKLSPDHLWLTDDLFLWWPTTAVLKEPRVPEFTHVPIQVTSEHPSSVVWQHLLTRHKLSPDHLWLTDDLFLWWPTTALLKEPRVPEFTHVPIQVTSEHPSSVVWQHLLTRHKLSPDHLWLTDDLFLWWPTTALLKEPRVPELICSNPSYKWASVICGLTAPVNPS